MRKGGDDGTEGETKAECERRDGGEQERRTREKRMKRGEGIAENRAEAGKAGKADEKKGIAGYGGGKEPQEWGGGLKMK